MAPRSEKSISEAVIKHARSKACICIKQSTMKRFGAAGWPDYLILLPRHQRTMWIEFKRLSERATPLQEERIKQLRSMGHTVYVVDNVPEGKRLINLELRRTA